MDELQREVLEGLIIELGITEESDKTLLSSKIKNACREVKQKRNYQKYHTEEFIAEDIAQFYSNVREMAMYDYNQIGGEGQLSHSENGTSRSWKDRKDCLNGVTAFCGVV